MSPIDGVVIIDPNYHKHRKVYAVVARTFRYGREDQEIMGLTFYTEDIMDIKQVYPPKELDQELTPLQERLINKFGKNSYPVTLKIPPRALPSVRLQLAKVYAGAPLGVFYELKLFTASEPEEKPYRRSTVRMALRCVHCIPVQSFNSLAPPSASLCKTFILSQGKLVLDVILDRDVYHHGDIMHVHVTIDNNSNKTVKKIKVYVIQHVHIRMFTKGYFKNLVSFAETKNGLPILPGVSLSRDFFFKLTSFFKYPVAIAVEGENDDVTILASSSLNSPQKEDNTYGITVIYTIKVKAVLGFMDRPVVVRIPFRICNYIAGKNGTISSSLKHQTAFSKELDDDDDENVSSQIFFQE
ncbi:phosrestin-1-like [Limulus polyphemus]|uniref:Phosrestin-1-like n=1 Tax=Limulus polyphemus TaxID=6850 RepID=A0ABM1BAH1_LIMPO|nr:phosrestin-1-like [Limulus polyphemus]